jgi:hypothetical protein
MTENGKYHARTGLLVIPLSLPNACHPIAPVEAEKSKMPSKVRQARWMGLDLGSSSDILETREIVDDQNNHGQSAPTIEPEEEDDCEYIDDVDVDDENEGEDHETNDDNGYLTEESDFEERTFKETESALRSLDGTSIASHDQLRLEVDKRTQFPADGALVGFGYQCSSRRAPEPVELVNVSNAIILVARHLQHSQFGIVS